MQQRRAKVQVVPATTQGEDDKGVDGNPDQRGGDHDPALHLLWSHQAPKGLEGDGQHDDDQSQRVDEGGKDADAVIAVAAPFVSGSLRLFDRKPGQAQSENVGQDVAGVRQQRKGVRQEPTGELDQEDGQGQA